MIGCALSIVAQISHLAQIDDGWLDGQGTAYDPRFLHSVCCDLRAMLERYVVPTPHLYPSEDGCVRLEWDGDFALVVVEIEPDDDCEGRENLATAMRVVILPHEHIPGPRELTSRSRLTSASAWRLIRSHLVNEEVS